MEQYRAILDPLLEREMRTRATCGLHYHALTINLSEPMAGFPHRVPLPRRRHLAQFHRGQSQVTPEVIDELRTGCRELLELLKPIFGRFARVGYEGSEDHLAFEVFSLLAETPLSLLRASGRNWREIEQLLSERAAVTSSEWDKSDRRLIRAIELAELTGCTSPEA